jgi:NAD(P)H-dependent FMN reductase
MREVLLACLTFVFPLIAEVNLLVISGSTRTDSYNKKLAKEVAAIARDMGAKVTLVDLRDYPLPLYDGDLEDKEGLPKNAKKLREAMVASDAVVIASPEYNASVSAVLKNAIDWVSRGSREAFEGKRFGLMSAAAGGYGGARGLLHLRTILEDVGATVIEQQVTVPRSYEKGAIESPAVKEAIKVELNELLQTAE